MWDVDSDVRGEERMRTGEERERCIEIIVCPWMLELPCDGRAARELEGAVM